VRAQPRTRQANTVVPNRFDRSGVCTAGVRTDAAGRSPDRGA
jgi:hypothetical protein